MESQSYDVEVGGKTITATFTDLALHAHGSVLVRMGETAILVTAVMSERASSAPYFPLSVEFEEKHYAAGAILGSRFVRREGKPSDEAVLSARIIDRTIRPLFDQRIRHDIQVVVSVLALGEEDPDVLGVIGASLALSVSDIPWDGPVGAVRVGRRRDTGAIIINPNYSEREAGTLDFELLACGTDGTVNMIEAAANEVPEQDIVTVLETCTNVHAVVTEFQKQIVAERGKSKRAVTLPEIPETVVQFFAEHFQSKLNETLFSGTPGKQHLHQLRDTFIEAVTASEIECATPVLETFFEDMVDRTLHKGAVLENRRADGRGMRDIRPLFAQAGGVSPVLHGSGIFYRGETHIFTALTLGGPDSAQIIDTIESPEQKKRYMHHYNFPPYSVGETGRVGGFNRRMIGHGALAEKALLPVIPPQSEFPYTIRLVSETLSSNGSSSMASVCGSTLALMDGGVPITRPVAGIASGVMIDGEQYALLTDIQGPEDEHGDMDFKVAGTTEGITALQMDVKVSGIPIHILTAALEDAKRARLEIIKAMNAVIAEPRATLSPRAPEIITLTVSPEQIGLVIGSGGKTINSIKETTGVEEISIEDDGTIYVLGKGGTATAAVERIKALTKIYEIGERVTVTVSKVVEFGAFATIDAFHEGLIHISEIAPFRVASAADYLHVGDQVPAVVTKVDNGKIGLSIKQIEPERFTPPATT